MAVLDTLQILIEADSRGLETQLKRSGENIVNFVSQLNKQEVNWTQILSRTISPAIIASIASLFASAITKTIAFQDTSTKMGTAVGMTGTQLTQFGTSLQDISMKTGVTDIQDLGKAFTTMYSMLGSNQNATNNVTEQFAMLEAAGYGTASALSSSLLPVMQAWGVTTDEQAKVVINAFLNAARSSGQSIETLASGFSQVQSGFVAGGASLNDLNWLMVAFGVNVGKIGLDATTTQFKLFAEGVAGGNPGLNALIGSVGSLKTSLKDGKIEEALNSISTKVTNAGVLVAGAFGVSEESFMKFKVAVQQYPDISEAAKKAAKNQTTVNDVFKETDTTMRTLNRTWATVEASMTSTGKWTALQSVLKVVLDDITAIHDLLTGKMTAEDVALKIAKGTALLAGAGAGALAGGEAGAALGSVVPGVGTAIGGILGALGGAILGGVATAGVQNLAQMKVPNMLPSQQGGNQTNNFNNVAAPITINSAAGESTITADKTQSALYSQFNR